MRTVSHYTVKYKVVGDLFWKKINNVVGDDTMWRPNRGGGAEKPGEDTMPVRTLYLGDHTRMEFPMEHTIFIFPKERQMMIEESIKEGKG